MLTSANVTCKMAIHYYENHDNYYTVGETLSPPRWQGQLAKELGLLENFSSRNFEQMLRGYGQNGEPLIANPDIPIKEKPSLSSEKKQEILEKSRECFMVLEDTTLQQTLEKSLFKSLEKGPLSAKGVSRLVGKFGRALEEENKCSSEEIASKRDQLRSILEGACAKKERRAGLDLTFSAPKSVSIQALVFGDKRLLEAHREAVKNTLEYLEQNFANTRKGSKSERKTVTTGNLAIAQFEHDLSREKDPHLHTHNVVMNMTLHDGKMRSLHNDILYQHKKMLGTMYRNELACRVRDLGYSVVVGKDGLFEIGGYQREQVEAFSKRHMQIWKRSPENQAQAYAHFYEGRKAKEEIANHRALKESWLKTAEALKLEEAAYRTGPTGKINGEIIANQGLSIEKSVASLTEKRVTYREQDLKTEQLATHLGRKKSTEIFREVEKYLSTEAIQGKREFVYTTKELLQREANYLAKVQAGVGRFEPVLPKEKLQALAASLDLRNEVSKERLLERVLESQKVVERQSHSFKVQKDITAVLEKLKERSNKMSPTEILELRIQVTDFLKSDGLKGTQRKELLREILEPVEKELTALTKGQKQAIVWSLSSRDQVILWQGVAGAGKTTSLREIVKEAKEAGFDVKGLAPSATAAKLLGEETGVSYATVDAHLVLKRDKELLQLQTTSEAQKLASKVKKLWIVDEASMISGKNFEKLMERATEERARVLLVGDSMQLTSVESGNPFLHVQRATTTTKMNLTESVRQKVPELQETVRRMYRGEMREAVRGLTRETVEAAEKEERCKIAAQAYLSMPDAERKKSLVISRTHDERKLITKEIREELQKEKAIGKDEKVTKLVAVDFTQAQILQGYVLSVGLVVETAFPEKKGFKKHQRFEVARVSEGNVFLQNENGKKLQVELRELERAQFYKKEELLFAQGDRVISTKNDRQQCLLNNEAFEVERITKEKVILKKDIQGEKYQVELERNKPLHLDHSWVHTVHRSQGQTAKNVIFVADSQTTKQEFLVGITRASQGVLVVAHDKERIEDLWKRDSVKEIASEVRKEAEIIKALGPLNEASVTENEMVLPSLSGNREKEKRIEDRYWLLDEDRLPETVREPEVREVRVESICQTFLEAEEKQAVHPESGQSTNVTKEKEVKQERREEIELSW